MLVEALFERIEVLGFREATLRLAENAIAYGFAAVIPEHHRHRLCVRRRHLDAAALQEGDHHHEGDALVAIHVRMIPSEAEGVGGGELGKGGFRLIVQALPGSHQRSTDVLRNG